MSSQKVIFNTEYPGEVDFWFDDEVDAREKEELRTNTWNTIDTHWKKTTTPREYFEVINGYPYDTSDEEAEEQDNEYLVWTQEDENLKQKILEQEKQELITNTWTKIDAYHKTRSTPREYYKFITGKSYVSSND